MKFRANPSKWRNLMRKSNLSRPQLVIVLLCAQLVGCATAHLQKKEAGATTVVGLGGKVRFKCEVLTRTRERCAYAWSPRQGSLTQVCVKRHVRTGPNCSSQRWSQREKVVKYFKWSPRHYGYFNKIHRSCQRRHGYQWSKAYSNCLAAKLKRYL